MSMSFQAARRFGLCRRGLPLRREFATREQKNLLGTELTLQAARSWSDAAADGFKSTSLDEIFGNKKVVVIGVPGAFTGACSSEHIPQFISEYAALKKQGVDDVICVSMNDPFAMHHWGQGLFVSNKIQMFADSDGSFTRWMDQEIDLSAAALGRRSNRYSMLVENGLVLEMNAENSPSDVKVSDARTMTRCVHRFMPTNKGYVY